MVADLLLRRAFDARTRVHRHERAVTPGPLDPGRAPIWETRPSRPRGRAGGRGPSRSTPRTGCAGPLGRHPCVDPRSPWSWFPDDQDVGRGPAWDHGVHLPQNGHLDPHVGLPVVGRGVHLLRGREGRALVHLDRLHGREGASPDWRRTYSSIRRVCRSFSSAPGRRPRMPSMTRSKR